MSGDTTPLIDVSSINDVRDTAETATAEDLVHHRALYDKRPGGWGRDWWFYLCNEHTLLSTFYADPDNPYTRHQRFVVLAVAASLALLLTSFSLYMRGLTKLVYSMAVAPIVLNLTHWGLDMVGACATAHAPHRDAEERDALATASDVAVERAAPVVGVAAAAAGVALTVASPRYTLVGVCAHWAQTQALGWAWGLVVDTVQYTVRRRLEVNAAAEGNERGAVFT